MHLGSADGALLWWAGRPLDAFRHEVGRSIRFMFWQHLALLVPACLIIALLMSSPLRMIAIAVLVFALIMNLATVLQNGLLGARQFKPVAFASAAPAAMFVLIAFLWHLRATPSFRALIDLWLR